MISQGNARSPNVESRRRERRHGCRVFPHRSEGVLALEKPLSSGFGGM